MHIPVTCLCFHRLQSGLVNHPVQCETRPSMCARTECGLNSDVTRWIEERDILLQTGVYTHSDPTIQKLDEKIKEAL